MVIVVSTPHSIVVSNAMNPRLQPGNLGHVVCWHPTYHLADRDDMSYEQFERTIRFNKKYIVITMYLNPFTGVISEEYGRRDIQEWTLAGFIYASNDEIKRYFGRNRITSKLRQTAMETLREELHKYNTYLQTEVGRNQCAQN